MRWCSRHTKLRKGTLQRECNFHQVAVKNVNVNVVKKIYCQRNSIFLRKKNYSIHYLTGQNRGLSGLKNIWPVIMTGNLLPLFSAPNLQTICHVWSNLCFETFPWLLSKDELNANWCGLFWLKDDLCDHFKHTAMKIDSSKKPKQGLYILFREGHILIKIVRFYSTTVARSLLMNGSRVIAKCFGCIFHSWLCWFYEFKV